MKAGLSTETGTRRPVILVVEDDENVLHLVSAYLEHEGYEVIQAGDGRKVWLAPPISHRLVANALSLPDPHATRAPA